jgi:hypothetical protein
VLAVVRLAAQDTRGGLTGCDDVCHGVGTPKVCICNLLYLVCVHLLMSVD